MKQAAIVVLLLCVGFLCFFLITQEGAAKPAQQVVRDYVRANGTQDTGALNLVTAIYLGYRAFDTLGETIVLFLAVIGVNLLFVKQR
ncbi:MAG: hypothetical protein JW852_10480 [Spirochaetales bacterium]|nr:hypothetical protein [Spirochaetales bacterium]